jgi:hypothetical protein
MPEYQPRTKDKTQTHSPLYSKEIIINGPLWRRVDHIFSNSSGVLLNPSPSAMLPCTLSNLRILRPRPMRCARRAVLGVTRRGQAVDIARQSAHCPCRKLKLEPIDGVARPRSATNARALCSTHHAEPARPSAARPVGRECPWPGCAV